jgi:hypothetical protein
VRDGGAGRPDVFDADAVGRSGAGFDYYRQTGTAPAPADALTSIALPPVALVRERGALLAHVARDGREGDGAEREAEALERVASGDAEAVFKKEVHGHCMLRALDACDAHDATCACSLLLQSTWL